MKLRTTYTLQIAVVALAMAIPGAAQTFQNFSSGSTGADGALDYSSTPSGTTVVFNPATHNPPLNPSGNNIFNFTTINIPAGVTVRLSGRILTGPVYWLATGNVTINGTIDLTGEAAGAPTNVPANRAGIAFPGAGGYASGIGGSSGVGTAGQGPAGGAGAGCYGGGGGFTGNTFLVPLIGGSGGGGGNGACFGPNSYGPSGAGGGGAILIASNTSIAFSGGFIYAYGGQGYTGNGGGGAGGAIHLLAPAIAANGTLNVSGQAGGANGRIRVETANYTSGFSFSGPFTITSSPTFYLPTTTPGTIKAISVGGVSLPASPTGSFATPDASIDTANSVGVVVQATNITVGTVVSLQINSEQSADMTIQCPALSGTLASSTTTCTVVFPAGFSRGYITATW